jgi:hypothetical protein
MEVAKTQAHSRTSPAVTCFGIESDNKGPRRRPREYDWSDVSSDDSLSSNSSKSLVASCLRQQILASYISRYETTSDSRSITDSRAWLTTLPAIPSPSKALETASYAVSLARLGATLDDPDIKQEGLKLYTQSLRRTQMALEDPKLMYSDETLAACMLLGIYEIFECPGGSRKAYKSHFGQCSTRCSFLETLADAILLRWLCEAHSASRTCGTHRRACSFHFSRIQIHGREHDHSLHASLC